MNKYKVSVLAEYAVTAASVDDAWEIVEKRAQFPIFADDEDTRCEKVTIIRVYEEGEEEEE